MLNYYHDDRQPAEDTLVALCERCAAAAEEHLTYLGSAPDEDYCYECDGPADDARACAWFARQRRARVLAEQLGLCA